jgi:hypothetical protein
MIARQLNFRLTPRRPPAVELAACKYGRKSAGRYAVISKKPDRNFGTRCRNEDGPASLLKVFNCLAIPLCLRTERPVLTGLGVHNFYRFQSGRRALVTHLASLCRQSADRYENIALTDQPDGRVGPTVLGHEAAHKINRKIKGTLRPIAVYRKLVRV